MTRKEAASRIRQALSVPNRLQGLVLIDEDSASMAIEALSQPIVCKDYCIDDNHIYCSPKVADRIVEALQTEVVRCGECRHKYMKDFDMFCPYMVGMIKPNMHCSYGERREP